MLQVMNLIKLIKILSGNNYDVIYSPPDSDF